MGYLLVRQADETWKVFLDEINTLIIENPACCVTCCLLAELVRCKIKVIFCDEKHSPCAELLPCHGHSESSGKLREQIQWDQQFCRLLWTRIVAEKIKKQSELLQENGNLFEAEMLQSYIMELQTGDVSNREGHAAKVYFNAIFGKGFKRGDGLSVDTALNYGYSLLLSAFNREIVACGFSTQLGLAHHNIFNHFNLSCDLLEPFRILVDRQVKISNFSQFDSKEKHRLLEIFDLPLILNGETQRLDNCIRLYVRSAFKAIRLHDLDAVKFYSWKK